LARTREPYNQAGSTRPLAAVRTEAPLMKQIKLSDRPFLAASTIADHAYLVQTRGYSLVPEFLNAQEVELLKEGMARAIEGYEPVPGVERSVLDRYQIHDLMNQDINFARLLEDPRLQQLCAPHLGEHWIMYAATSSSIPPGGTNYASRLHVDSPRFHPGYAFNMGVIWALDDYTRENGGALKVLPGSHHAEAAPDEAFFEQNCEQVECKAGALLLFSARLFHRTSANHTSQWNHSMTMNACRAYMKQRMDWVRFLKPGVTDQLSPQARRIIGFDTRLPTSLEEFFLPEAKRLYKPNQG
jgi:ectoine hydroxylase-related dioxygenase (phytanoyl-CoA dioxygenase family)